MQTRFSGESKENKSNIHGGNIAKASKVYGIKPDEFLDYSANINPFGIPSKLKEIIHSCIDDIINYPDPEYIELKQKIAQYLNVGEDCIIPGNGASEIIYLLLSALNIKKVLIPAPSFSEYAIAADIHGCEVEYFHIKENEDFKIDIQKLSEKIKDGYDALFLCNPNNPTSVLAQKHDLLEILNFATKNSTLVVIDETFIELTANGNESSMGEHVANFENMFIIRAFTKIFGIPGLRLGYGIGHNKLIQRLWAKKIPWSVNTLAAAVAKFLPYSHEYLEAARIWIKEEKEWFYERLCRIEGIKVFKPETNFILIKLLREDIKAGILYDKMAREGILIRDASNFMYLDDSFIRVAIKDRERNKVFLKAFRNVLNEGEQYN